MQFKGKLVPNWFYLLMAYMHQIRFRLGLLCQKVTNFFIKILKEQNAESAYSFQV